MKRYLLIALTLIVLTLFGCTSTENISTIDYSDKANWAYYAEGGAKDVDLFIICPTVDMGHSGNTNMAMDDEKTKASFVGALNMERGIYESRTTMYAPYYRQMTFPLYSDRKAESGKPFDIAFGDIKNAFEYYLNNINNGRPFIIAGFSQGAQMTIALLKEYFSDPQLQDRLVAAYAIGWKITDEDLKNYPEIKMATGESDTGVVISFNSEAVDIKDSIIVPSGVKTHGINPLNWKTDSTKADKSLNKGACFTDYDGNITKEINALTGAYLDNERGTLKAVDINPSDYSNHLFPDGVYHLDDYQFFFRNLEENVKTRIDAYLSQNAKAA